MDNVHLHTRIAALANRDTMLRHQTVQAICPFGDQAVPLLIAAFRNAEQWYGAVEVLAAIGLPAVLPLIAAHTLTCVPLMLCVGLGNRV